MDHLRRKPLLLEFSHVSVQRLKPGAQPKARTRRLGRTSADMPTRPGEHARLDRRAADHRRLNQARDRQPGMTKRHAEKVRSEGRPLQTSHLHKKRGNPNAPARSMKRGNPQAKSQTQIRISPSKLDHRPSISKTAKMITRGDMMRGRRL